MCRPFTVVTVSIGYMDKSVIWQHLSKVGGFLLIVTSESLQFMQKRTGANNWRNSGCLKVLISQRLLCCLYLLVRTLGREGRAEINTCTISWLRERQELKTRNLLGTTHLTGILIISGFSWWCNRSTDTDLERPTSGKLEAFHIIFSYTEKKRRQIQESWQSKLWSSYELNLKSLKLMNELALIENSNWVGFILVHFTQKWFHPAMTLCSVPSLPLWKLYHYEQISLVACCWWTYLVYPSVSGS